VSDTDTTTRPRDINEPLIFKFFLSSNDTQADKEAHSGSPIIIQHEMPTTARSVDLPSSINRQIPPKMCCVTLDSESEALVDHVKLEMMPLSVTAQLTCTRQA
jgi:hypothetical protein